MVLNRAGQSTALWVVPVSDIGGTSRHVLDVARAGIPGWNLHVVLPPGPAVASLASTGVAMTVAPIGPAHGLRRSVATYRSALRAVRPEIVHSHLSYADLLTTLASPRGTILVSTEHGIADDDLVYHGSRRRAAARARLHRARLRRNAAVVAVSGATLAAMRRKWRLGSATPSYVIPNGITAPRPPAVARGSVGPGPHVVSLSRLAAEKRLDDLVAGFALLAAERPDAQLTLAGTGPLEDALREQADRLGIADRVHLPGVVAPDGLLGEADVLAQLSVWENCSYSLLDALVHGLGVVASPVGGNPELLPTRCLVDPSDHAGVAEALASQARVGAARPTLPCDWPDVATMTRRLGEVYAEVRPGLLAEPPVDLVHR